MDKTIHQALWKGHNGNSLILENTQKTSNIKDHLMAGYVLNDMYPYLLNMEYEPSGSSIRVNIKINFWGDPTTTYQLISAGSAGEYDISSISLSNLNFSVIPEGETRAISFTCSNPNVTWADTMKTKKITVSSITIAAFSICKLSLSGDMILSFTIPSTPRSGKCTLTGTLGFKVASQYINMSYNLNQTSYMITDSSDTTLNYHRPIDPADREWIPQSLFVQKNSPSNYWVKDALSSQYVIASGDLGEYQLNDFYRKYVRQTDSGFYFDKNKDLSGLLTIGNTPTFDNNFAQLDYTGDKYISITRENNQIKIYDSNTKEYTYVYYWQFRNNVVPNKIFAILQGAGDGGICVRTGTSTKTWDTSFCNTRDYAPTMTFWAMGGPSGATVPVLIDFNKQATYYFFIGKGGIIPGEHFTNEGEWVIDASRVNPTGTYITTAIPSSGGLPTTNYICADCGKVPNLTYSNYYYYDMSEKCLLDHLQMNYEGHLKTATSSILSDNPLQINKSNLGIYVLNNIANETLNIPKSGSKVVKEMDQQVSTQTARTENLKKYSEDIDHIAALRESLYNLSGYYQYSGKCGPLVYLQVNDARRSDTVTTSRWGFCDVNYMYEHSEDASRWKLSFAPISSGAKFFDWEYDDDNGISIYGGDFIENNFHMGWYDFEHTKSDFDYELSNFYLGHSPESTPLNDPFYNFTNKYCGRCWVTPWDNTEGYSVMSAGGAPSPFANGGYLISNLNFTYSVTACGLWDTYDNPCELNSNGELKLTKNKYDVPDMRVATRGAGGAVIVKPVGPESMSTQGGPGCVFLYY